MRIVVALGGNAILPRGAAGGIQEQRAAIREASGELAKLVADGHELVLTHGNGPQVGRLMMQDEASPASLPTFPLDVHVAETQGMLGYLIQQEMGAALRRARAPRDVVALVTQVVVDPADPAFVRPTKPVGPYLGGQRVAELRAAGQPVVEVPGGGWRRAVPSPAPRAIVEEEAIRGLVERDVVVIASGGGGIPVVREGNSYRGVPAVVDKDLSAAVLCAGVGGDMLLILTDVPEVVAGYGTPGARALRRMTVAEALEGVEAGMFPRGSMGEKVLAAADAARRAARAVIGSLHDVRGAVAGSAGTEIVP